MKIISYKCDRCSKLITGNRYTLETMVADFDTEAAKDCYQGAELCEECYDIVDKAVLAAMKMEPVADPEEQKQTKRVKLDTGKVGALKRAGWSVRKIADEMGVSDQTIYNALKKLEEDGKL